MATKKCNSKSVKGFNLPLFAKQFAENVSSFEMWLFWVCWEAPNTFLQKGGTGRLQADTQGRSHRRKGSNVSTETERRDAAMGRGLWAATSSGWSKAHILPWSLQKGAGTTHTSIAFPRPPGPRGDKCLLCKASVFVEIGYCVCRMYYCWLGRLIYIKMKSECRSQLSVVRFEGALSFLWAGKGRMLNFRAGSSIIQVQIVFPLLLSSVGFFFFLTTQRHSQGTSACQVSLEAERAPMGPTEALLREDGAQFKAMDESERGYRPCL